MNRRLFEHKVVPDKTIVDLFETKDILNIFLRAGVAEEHQLADMKRNPETMRTVNNATILNQTVVYLVEEARRGQKYSYAPYSHFNVGATILAENKYGDRRVFTGCNVENAAYGSTICAERTATCRAVSEGFRKFHACAVVGGFDTHVSKALRTNAQKEIGRAHV